MFSIFDQPCKTCGGMNLGPREGGKARGRWLGYDDCPKCREKAEAEQSGVSKETAGGVK